MGQVIEIMKVCINYMGDDLEFISELRWQLIQLLQDNITIFDEDNWAQAFDQNERKTLKHYKAEFITNNHLTNIVQ